MPQKIQLYNVFLAVTITNWNNFDNFWQRHYRERKVLKDALHSPVTKLANPEFVPLLDDYRVELVSATHTKTLRYPQNIIFSYINFASCECLIVKTFAQFARIKSGTDGKYKTQTTSISTAPLYENGTKPTNLNKMAKQSDQLSWTCPWVSPLQRCR